MSKKTKIFLLILCGIFIVTGLIFVMFYSRSKACGGFACIFLGLGMFVLGIHNKFCYEEKLSSLSESVDEYLQETESQHGESYSMENESKMIKKAYDKLKKTDRTHISLFLAGMVLIILSFFIF